MTTYEICMLSIAIITLVISILAFILSVMKIMTGLLLELIKNKN